MKLSASPCFYSFSSSSIIIIIFLIISSSSSSHYHTNDHHHYHDTITTMGIFKLSQSWGKFFFLPLQLISKDLVLPAIRCFLQFQVPPNRCHSHDFFEDIVIPRPYFWVIWGDFWAWKPRIHVKLAILIVWVFLMIFWH